MRSSLRLSLLVCLILTLSIGCEKDEFANYEYITPGCIPSKITLTEPTFGGTVKDFIYDDNCLNRIGPSEYRYSNGLVSEIWTYDDNYEKYFYDESGTIIRTERYRIPFMEDEFKLVAQYDYIYSGDKIIEVIENIDNERYDLFYQTGTNNLDSLHTYNSLGQLIRRDLYKHDNQKNLYSNLKFPKTGYLFWLQYRAGDNNITKHSIFDYTPFGQNNVFDYTYEYNSFGYPVKRSQGNAHWDIEYINCQ